MHTTICKIKRNCSFGKSSPPDRFYNLWKKVLEPRKSMRKEQKINAFLSIDTKFMYITCYYTEAALFDYTIFPI